VRRRLTTTDLGAAWESHATAWVAWARRDGHDSYWRFNRDLFLELVPPPSVRTLDLGCGEGRLSRDLKTRGHTVVGLDASPTLVAAAREADPESDLVVADAADLPFPDESFGCVVAFMSLQDLDDLDGAVSESARVLAPGGAVCVAVVHPLNSAGTFVGTDDPEAPFVIEGSYLDVSYYADDIAVDDLEMTFVSVHRPLEAYTRALLAAGLIIDVLREVRIPEGAGRGERSRRWQRIPLFLYLRAVKP
jgi:SAM-dependent methyltransferase